MEKKIEWILDQHRNTNHLYSEYLPYEFHLRMVVNIADKFMGLMVNETNLHPGNPDVINLRLASFGHDLCEDCRITYNDVKGHLGYEVADIIYALTNEKGKTRKERANDKYYEGIRNTHGAVFVKLCDRIANVQYSKMTGSRMFEMYKKENDEFIVQLGWDDTNTRPYFKMFSYLHDLFKD